MLRDVIEFVRSRTAFKEREVVLREINLAFAEVWNTDDLPNSIEEISVEPIDNTSIISLPYYVGEIRAVKMGNRERVELNTPRAHYQSSEYTQSPYTHRILGTSPLYKSVANATTLTLTFDKPVAARTIVTLMGPTDISVEDREQVIFEIGDIEHETTKRFTDLIGLSKDLLTETNLRVLTSAAEEVGFIPNSYFEARNVIVQISDKCLKECNNCRCFDVLYKKTAPYLYYDETPVPMEQVIMTKCVEWILMPGEGQEQRAVMFGEKSRTLLSAFNGNERGIEQRMDFKNGQFTTHYCGQL